MHRPALIFSVMALLTLSACAGVDRTTGERTVSGTAIGAAGGAAAGLVTGNFWTGLAAGAAGGAASGFVYDQIEKNRAN